MNNFLKKLEKWYDIHIVYFLYNGHKRQRYYQYLRHKYGEDL